MCNTVTTALYLTHCSWDKMAAILQTACWNPSFLHENCCILIEISMKFVPKGPIDNMSAFVQVMAWCWSSHKPLSEPLMTYLMPPSHCCELCLRTNTNWHSLCIIQHRIDSNCFVLVHCHFLISSQANTNVLNIRRIEAYWYCVILNRQTSYQFVSVPIGSYLIVVHSYRFVVQSHWDSPSVACDSVRCNTMHNDRIVVLDRTCSHWFV